MVTLLKDIVDFCDLIGSPIVIVSQPDFKIVHCNETAEDMFGYEMAKLKDSFFLEYFDDRSRRIIFAKSNLIQFPNSSPTIKGSNLQLRRRSGRQLLVNMTASLFHAHHSTYIIFTIEDMTELQKQSLERAKMQGEVAQVAKLTEISHLADGLAREINAPLSVLQDSADFLNHHLNDPKIDIERLRQNLTPVLGQVDNLNRVIMQLMSLGGYEAPQLQEVGLKEWTENFCQNYQDIFESQKVKCSINISDDIFGTVDPNHFEQILTQIVNNALRALEGTSDARIEISASRAPKSVILRVWNNGPEIPSVVRANIFSPLFTDKTSGDILGVGLYLCYNMIRALGGELWFESDPVKGTAFFLKVSTDPTIQRASLFKRPRFIVVDTDEEFATQVIGKRLARLGISMRYFRSGQEVLESMQEDQAFQGLLTAVNLPHMDGWQLIETLKIIKPKMPIGIITENPTEAQIKRAESLRLNGLIGRPVADIELKRLLRNMLSAEMGFVPSVTTL
jgi:PAS domain S-box-containing protein